MRKKLFQSGFLGLFFLMCFSSVAFAQLLLETGKVSLSLKPGETALGEIKVDNITDQEISVKAYWQDFVYTPPFDGSKKFFRPGTKPESCGQWTTFNPQSFTLKAYEKKVISYNVKFPSDANGGYYGVLFFESGKGQKDTRTGVNVIARVGCLFFLETAGSERKASILNASASGKGFGGEIQNKSQIVLIPHGIFYIMNSEGMVVDRGETENFYLPAGQGAPFFINISDKVAQGTYTVVLTFELGDGATVVQEIDIQKNSDSSIQILQVRD